MVDKSIVQSIEKAALILELFSKRDSKLTLNEIVIKTSLSKTTAFRLCNTLEKIGYLEKIYIGNTPYYRLGIKLFHMGSLALKNIDLLTISKPYLKHISDVLGDTGHLFIERNETAYCLLNVEGALFVKSMSIEIGDTLPLYMGGAPLSILAFLNDNEQAKVLYNMNLNEEAKVKLKQEVKDIRANGYSLSINQVIPGTAAVGAPIFNHKGELTAAISVAGLVERFSDDRLPMIVDLVVSSARKISLELGCQLERLLI